MDITGLSALAAAVAALVAVSIFSVGAATFVNAMSDKANSRRKVVGPASEVGSITPDERTNPENDGATVPAVEEEDGYLKVTFRAVYRGKRAWLVKALLMVIPRFMLFSYIAVTYLFLLVPLRLLNGSRIVIDQDGTQWVRLVDQAGESAQPSIFTTINEVFGTTMTWTNAVVSSFSVYCVTVAFLILLAKVLLDRCVAISSSSEYIVRGKLP